MDTIIIAVLTIVGYAMVSLLTSQGFDAITTILITSLAEGIALASTLAVMLKMRERGLGNSYEE